MKFPNVIGGSYVSQSPIADCERTINFYVEKMEVPGAKSKVVLYPTPGVKHFADTQLEINGRGMFSQSNYTLAAVGDKILRVHANGTTTVLGTVAVDDNPVTFTANTHLGGWVFLTSGGKGYTVRIDTDVLAEAPLPAGVYATMGAMLDTYFIALDGVGNKSHFYLSDLDDPTTPWDPTNGSGRQVGSDPWVAMVVNYREIWLFGTETSEVWVNVLADPGQPFAPHPSGLIPYGIAAPFSVKNVSGTLLWLTRTKNGTAQVVAAEGYSPRVVSTHAVSHAMEEYGRLDDAIADTFQMLGHSFYVLTFPSANHTWVYDMTTQVWVEWLTWLEHLSEYIAWRPLHHAFAFDKHLVLDRDAGGIYETSHTFTTDVGGQLIRRMRRFPGVIDDLNRVYYDLLTLYVEMGLGLPMGQGSNPQIMLRHSDDGGKTFGNERWCSGGRIGEYKQLAQWYRLGAGRDRIFELVVSDPIPWRIIDAFVTVRKARH